MTYLIRDYDVKRLQEYLRGRIESLEHFKQLSERRQAIIRQEINALSNKDALQAFYQKAKQAGMINYDLEQTETLLGIKELSVNDPSIPINQQGYQVGEDKPQTTIPINQQGYQVGEDKPQTTKQTNNDGEYQDPAGFFEKLGRLLSPGEHQRTPDGRVIRTRGEAFGHELDTGFSGLGPIEIQPPPISNELWWDFVIGAVVILGAIIYVNKKE